MQNIFLYLPQLLLLFFLDPPHLPSTPILCTLLIFTSKLAPICIVILLDVWPFPGEWLNYEKPYT